MMLPFFELEGLNCFSKPVHVHPFCGFWRKVSNPTFREQMSCGGAKLMVGTVDDC